VVGTVTATTFAGSGSSLTSLPAANLTGSLPAISGANLTGLNASNLSTGTIAAARMPALTGDVTMAAGTTTTAIAAGVVGTTELSATGTPSASTFLRGDNTWAAPSLSESDPQVGTLTASNFCMANAGGTAIDCSTAAISAATQLTGTLAAARFPALTGNVTTTAGSLATTFANGVVTNAMLAGSIDLTAKVTGTLPVANGGTGTSNGSITGTGALTFAAGGSNQNVTLTPSGTGYTILNGNVGIGTTSPGQKLSVAGTIESTSGGVKFPDGTTQTTAASAGGISSVTTTYCDAASSGTCTTTCASGYYRTGCSSLYTFPCYPSSTNSCTGGSGSGTAGVRCFAICSK
jgi:LysM repeat protein